MYSDGDWSDEEGGAEAGASGAASSGGGVGEESLPSFPKLDAAITKHIAKLGGSIFPKLTWSAPRDAAWIATDGTLRCTNPGEIYLLLKSSEFVAHDLSSPYEGCPDTVQPAPEGGAGAGADGGCKAAAAAAAASPAEVHLVLRKWTAILTAGEFRCFVTGNELVAISQRDYTTFYPSLVAIKAEVEADLVTFFTTKIKGKFAGGRNYTFDVYRRGTEDVLLIDFNPFSPVTDALLFTWGELSADADADTDTDTTATTAATETLSAARPQQPPSPPQSGAAPVEEGTDVEGDPVGGGMLPGVMGAPCNVDRYEPPAEIRELSQNDHINKSLLTAFLDRINDPSYIPPAFNDPIGDITADFADSDLEDDDDDEEAGKPRLDGGGAATPVATATPEVKYEPEPAAGAGEPAPRARKAIIFRIVETKADARMRPGIYATSRLPKDAVELQTATDIETLAKMYRDGKLDPAGHDARKEDPGKKKGQQREDYAALLPRFK